MKRERPIIAIDGPVGAGKSTVARALARALGFSYLNTGAMYRAVAVAAREAGISPDGANAGAARGISPDARVTDGTPGESQAAEAENFRKHLAKVLDTMRITFK